ncbi:hypothetical protein EYF80_032458 [Liparis tanakae]|uniref:Uncharacterized protein n=1 Tax=Liparis tanakae TaxID=230148 RepID=A0A4Z2GXJ8_9TELE|nr:hypothetical protein EYF80_032458 [Liparis tanakae]
MAVFPPSHSLSLQQQQSAGVLPVQLPRGNRRRSTFCSTSRLASICSRTLRPPDRNNISGQFGVGRSPTGLWASLVDHTTRRSTTRWFCRLSLEGKKVVNTDSGGQCEEQFEECEEQFEECEEQFEECEEQIEDQIEEQFAWSRRLKGACEETNVPSSVSRVHASLRSRTSPPLRRPAAADV